MKSKEEIEEFLGIKIKYSSERIPVTYGEDLPFGEIEYKYISFLSDESKDAVKKLMEDSIKNNDLETANTCKSILDEKPKVTTQQQINDMIRDANRKASIEFQKKIDEERIARERAENEEQRKKEEQARLKREQYEKEQVELKAKMESEQKARIKAEQQERLEREKQAREEEERLTNSEEVDYLIEKFRNNEYWAFWGKPISEIDIEIKNKIKLLEEKIEDLENEGESIEKSEKKQILSERIEKLEDAWEVYTQGFYNENMFKSRNTDGNIFIKYRTNYISIKDSFELYEKFKKGEEIPELFGKHHKERVEREQQARLKAEQEEKERQASIEKDIAEYEQYEELISRKPELDKLFSDLYYEDFSASVNGHISERMVDLLDDLKKLPENERKIILQRYNGLADLTINEQGQIIKDGIVQDLPERKDNEQESTQVEQIEVETVVEDHWNRVNLQQAKEYEQQQPERIRPREESIRDTIGDKRDKQSKMQIQEVKSPTVDLWMNRFNSWYSAIDRVSQNAKAKFVKMKSDIINAISNKIKERMNKREVNTQEQNSSER